MAAIASTMGTARGSTHGSWRPRGCTMTGLPWMSTLSCACRSVATGLKATRKVMGWPLLMPPCMPPEWLDFAESASPGAEGRKMSLTSLPRLSTIAKPSPYSKPFTALMLSMAAPSWAWSLPKTGSPRPTGHPVMTPAMMPPMVSPSPFTCMMSCSMRCATAASGQRTSLLSMRLRSSRV